MIKSNTSYSFPFQKIFDFLENGIDKKLKEFYNSFNNGFFRHRIKEIDLNKREVQFYKEFYSDGELEYDTHSFENEIKFYFVSLIYESFDVIAQGMNVCFISNQSTLNYLEKLDRQLNGLLLHPKNNDFSFVKFHLNLIAKELNHYRILDNVSGENQKYNSPFKPKDNIKRSFFHHLYDIAILHNIIREDFPKEDFIDVFTSSATTKHITFKCNNHLMVCFFEGIKFAFDNLNAISIGKSKRFFSKQNTLLTTTNYETSKSRIKSSHVITELNQDLEDLISDLI